MMLQSTTNIEDPAFLGRNHLSIINNHCALGATSTTVVSALQIAHFMQNKPNFRKAKMNVKMVSTGDYERKDTWWSGKNKPNSNPIQSQSNPIKANKMPKQTQYKPKQTQFQTRYHHKRMIINKEFRLLVIKMMTFAYSPGRRMCIHADSRFPCCCSSSPDWCCNFCPDFAIDFSGRPLRLLLRKRESLPPSRNCRP